MWRRVLREATVRQPWSMISSKRCLSSSPTSKPAAVDNLLLRYLKEHYVEVSKMNPPPKVNPPSEFSIVKSALDGNGPVLTRTYGTEEIKLSVMRMAYAVPGGVEDDENDEDMNQLFLHVDVSKPGQDKSLHFLCGLYPDALGVHSVSLRPKLDSAEFLEVTATYSGPHFAELDERMRDAFHGFIEERGVDEKLFNFLQAWLYVKEHRSLMRWFKTAGAYINENKPAKSS
ncbi:MITOCHONDRIAL GLYCOPROTEIN FAMILY PROTEIN-LIKE [Salix purpurea]|uniref:MITOCHONDRIAL GLYCOPROTEIN FAMILY PROTEIN-LIKE n=1 Tax=Salix purpurea TaxID=77065 RepID=A0A9Q0TT83_SALPP|nr:MITOCHONDRIAL GLYCOPROTEIN FAMILY PROTEIN-LIKE [Salix purpurea]